MTAIDGNIAHLRDSSVPIVDLLIFIHHRLIPLLSLVSLLRCCNPDHWHPPGLPPAPIAAGCLSAECRVAVGASQRSESAVAAAGGAGVRGWPTPGAVK